MPNKYGFILIVIGLAALIWLFIGLVYCLICMRSVKKKKNLKKNGYKKEYIRYNILNYIFLTTYNLIFNVWNKYSNNDPYGPKSKDGNSSEKSAKLDTCIKKSINQVCCCNIFAPRNVKQIVTKKLFYLKILQNFLATQDIFFPNYRERCLNLR